MSEAESRAAIEKHGLHPITEPRGDCHHTDAPFVAEDSEIAELAFWLGGLFVDKDDDPFIFLKDSYWYKEMTSVDVWKRVARALRIHGLKIVDVGYPLGGISPVKKPHRLVGGPLDGQTRDIPDNFETIIFSLVGPNGIDFPQYRRTDLGGEIVFTMIA